MRNGQVVEKIIISRVVHIVEVSKQVAPLEAQISQLQLLLAADKKNNAQVLQHLQDVSATLKVSFRKEEGTQDIPTAHSVKEQSCYTSHLGTQGRKKDGQTKQEGCWCIPRKACKELPQVGQQSEFHGGQFAALSEGEEVWESDTIREQPAINRASLEEEDVHRRPRQRKAKARCGKLLHTSNGHQRGGKVNGQKASLLDIGYHAAGDAKVVSMNIDSPSTPTSKPPGVSWYELTPPPVSEAFPSHVGYDVQGNDFTADEMRLALRNLGHAKDQFMLQSFFSMWSLVATGADPEELQAQFLDFG